jgi:hypothetical protein
MRLVKETPAPAFGVVPFWENQQRQKGRGEIYVACFPKVAGTIKDHHI